MLIILNRKQVAVGAANNVSPYALPYFDDYHEDTLDGIDTYKFIVPAGHPDSGLIEPRGHIILTDANNEQRLYTIKEITDTYYDFNKPAKEIFCECTAITELLGDVVRPRTLKAVDARMAIAAVLNEGSMGWGLGQIEETYTVDFKIEEHMTVLEALRKLTDEQFFKDLYFTVELTGTRISKKLVNFREDRGEETKVRFDYSIDLRGAGRTEDTSMLATAIIGLGKADSNGKRLSLASVPAFDDGDFYKEDDVDWIGSEKSLRYFGLDGNHIFGIHVDDQADTIEKLINSTKRALEDRCIPAIYYSASIENLAVMDDSYSVKQVRLGDWVHISDWTFDPPIVIKGKVMKLERSYLDPSQDKVDLGRYKKIEISVPANVMKLQDKIAQNEEKWNASVYKVEVVSSQGNIFKQNGISTVLEARVWANDREVTLDLPSTAYRWTRISSDSKADAIWNLNNSGGTRTITITPDDVKGRAVFNCEVNLE